jgi:hypothetical protein
MAGAAAPTEAVLEAHEAGDHNLRRAMRPSSVAVAACGLGPFALGIAAAKGGVVELAMQSVVVVAALVHPLVARRRWASADSWLLGLLGEATVAHLMAMLSDTFHCWHDVSVRSNGKRSNIGHLVGPTGIWVIETKNWKGTFEKRKLARRGGPSFVWSGGAGRSGHRSCPGIGPSHRRGPGSCWRRRRRGPAIAGYSSGGCIGS